MKNYLIGQLLRDRYRVDAHVGSGRMADVFQGHDIVLDRPVAIKLLTGGDAPTRARFVNEARAMARLNHQNIIGIYDFGEHDSYAYIVMEYAAGGSLGNFHGGSLSFADLHAIFLQVLVALDLAHKRKIIHRDLKPANVLLTEDRIAKVADFGLSRRVSDLPSTGVPGEIVGSVAYLAPEIFLGRPSDGRGDLYSLGVMLYEAFTGRLPFQSDSGDLVAVIYAHVHETPVPPRALERALPSSLERLIMRLLEKEPEKRFADATDVLAELSALRLGADARADVAHVESASLPLLEPAAVEPVQSAVFERIISPQRSTKAAFGKILGAMLAARRNEFADAVVLYNEALIELHTLKSETEFVKGAISMGDCLVAWYRKDIEHADTGMGRAALAHLEEANGYARSRNLKRELHTIHSLIDDIQAYVRLAPP